MKTDKEASKVVEDKETYCYVPDKEQTHVPWGNFDKIESVIKSRKFYPMWVTGPAGNGKSTTIEQVCAKLGRPFVRVNFTSETSEDDLIGGQRLVNGSTVFQHGPVVEALRAGAILLLDEVDAGHTNRILCLQSVLEGRGVLVKATGEWVRPSKGFNVLATSNTQGRGSDDGKYVGTNVMNGAFLDRFAAMVHQPYPPREIEQQILQNYVDVYMEGTKWNQDFQKGSDKQKQDMVTDLNGWLDKLVTWADHTRKLEKSGQFEDVITTRSLINIVQSFSIYEDKSYAIKVACDRFNEATSAAFVEFYDKISGGNWKPEEKKEEKKQESTYCTF